MDYYLIVNEIYPRIEFNPACFNFTEKEARRRKLWNDKRAMPTRQKLNSVLLKMNKLKSITIKYETMVEDIDTEMKKVFSTTKKETVFSLISIWEAMLRRPANYIHDELSTTEKVVTFATIKLNEADAYGLFIVKKRKQFKTDKAAILA